MYAFNFLSSIDSESRLELLWQRKPALIENVVQGKEIDGTNWEINSYVEENRDNSSLTARCTKTGGRTCAKNQEYLKMYFTFERSRTLFYVQTMVPTVLLVTASFGSLFVPPSQVPARMTLAITTCLTLMAMMTSTYNTAPSTSYLKVSFVFFNKCALKNRLAIDLVFSRQLISG